MKKGFTLIELVMVIVILGILAAVVFPRFISLQSQATQSAAKGAIGSVRSAIAIAYANNAASGDTTPTPAAITADMFQDNKIPVEVFSNTNEVTAVGDVSEITATGIGWAYDAANGRVWINNSQYTSY